MMANDLLKKDPKAAYQFNLLNLENAALKALEDWRAKDTDSGTRTKLFTSIKDLAYAILCVGDYQAKYKLNPDETAYEYALYLFERLLMGTFDPKPQEGYTRFPFQRYITVNLKHIIITKNKDKNWHELLVDLEYLVNLENNGMMDFDPQHEGVDFKMDKQGLSKKLYSALKVYYTEDEIRRLLPISMSLLDLDSKVYLSENQPRDVRDFIKILICVAKRILTSYNINELPHDYSLKEFKKVVSSSIRSTVFLSAVVNQEFFPKELLLTLDIDSLYRLIAVSGGETVRIPTRKELDALIGTVVTVSKVIMEGKSVETSLIETKEDLELMFPTRIRGTNINSYISKILEVHNIFGEESSSSEPIINNLMTAIKSIDKMLEHLVKDIDKKDPEKVLEYYKQISTTFKILSDGLAKISAMAIGNSLKNVKEDQMQKENG